MNETLKKFQSLLKNFFQFDSFDSDLGLYRILNHKRKQIKEFIEDKIPNILEKAIEKHEEKFLDSINNELEKLKIEIAKNFGDAAFIPVYNLKDQFRETPLGRKYLEVKARKEELDKIEEIKYQVFNDLYNFFSRYYQGCNFIFQYRCFIKAHKYRIPWNSEEVKLYWQNFGQYCSKTGLLFISYNFKACDYKIIFGIASPKEELSLNNSTKERFFILDIENPIVYFSCSSFPSSRGVDAEGGRGVPHGKIIHWKSLPYNPKLKEKAKKLRKDGNLAEVLFWQKVKNKQFLGLDFDRQKIIGNYIVDFFCKDLGFVVEIDGESHNFKAEYDEKRDKYLKNLGLKVYHFLDKDIRENLDGVLEWLKEEILNTLPLRDTPPERNTPSAFGSHPSERGERNTPSAFGSHPSERGERNTPSLRETPLEEGKSLIIRFQHRELTKEEIKQYGIEGGSNIEKQEKINQKSYDEILKEITNLTLKAFLGQLKNEIPLLLYHLNRFTAKNTIDYFIYKNLKSFLTEQLNYFIKSEILNTETLSREKYFDKYITRAKTVKEIADAIIEFLSQIEDFQK